MLSSVLVILGLAGGAWYTWERSHRRTHPVPAGLQANISLPHELEFELYHNAFSLCSKKIRLCLAELGIDYAIHHVDLIETGSYQNIGRDFLAVNPGATVPVLVHNGHPVYESHDQILYAALNAPTGTPALVPGDSTRRAEMEKWVARSSVVGDNPVRETAESAGNAAPGLTVPIFSAMMEEIPVTRVLEGLLFHRIKTRPLIFLGLKARGLRGLKNLKPAMALLHTSGRAMRVHLDALEDQLAASGGPWIIGDQFSLADISWAVIMERLVEAESIHLFVGNGKRPAVTAWWQATRSRPSWDTAICAQRHPTVERGRERLRRAKSVDPGLAKALEEF
jgi:glutathione S-transferase